jgi:hypothetical protein|tara:strand:+ start:2737 stop:3087 length:351 start_codon:yes stop_codon:yes gene_type:complete
MKTNIIVKLQVEGTHNWPQASDFEPTMEYLEYQHRHMFYIVAKKEVFHDDRDVEFIVFKRKIKKYLKSVYYNETIDCCDFGSQSCEMLAHELYEKFSLCYCSVSEDNENGAEVYDQ